MRRLIPAARRAWTWFLRVLVSFWMHTGWLPRPLLIVWLEWLDESTDARCPRKSRVVIELAEVRGRCRG